MAPTGPKSSCPARISASRSSEGGKSSLEASMPGGAPLGPRPGDGAALTEGREPLELAPGSPRVEPSDPSRAGAVSAPPGAGKPSLSSSRPAPPRC
eukprot:1628618-Pyramimonas_sp.AAC.1